MEIWLPAIPWQQSFELEINVKWEKAGRRKIDGWARKVFTIPICQQAKMTTRKPGRRKVKTAMAAPPARSSEQHGQAETALARATSLPTKMRPQEKKMRMNRGERSPPTQLF